MSIATEVYLPIVTAISGQNHRTNRKLGNNTYGRIEDNTVAVRLHWTDVVTATVDSATYSSGGWETSTTKNRINDYLPNNWILYQRDYVWYVAKLVKVWHGDNYSIESHNGAEFYDGITFVNDADGNAVIK